MCLLFIVLFVLRHVINVTMRKLLHENTIEKEGKTKAPKECKTYFSDQPVGCFPNGKQTQETRLSDWQTTESRKGSLPKCEGRMCRNLSSQNDRHIFSYRHQRAPSDEKRRDGSLFFS